MLYAFSSHRPCSQPIEMSYNMCLKPLSWPLIPKKLMSRGQNLSEWTLLTPYPFSYLPHDQKENAGHRLILVSCLMTMMLACEIINVLDLPSIKFNTTAFCISVCMHNNTSHVGSWSKSVFLLVGLTDAFLLPFLLKSDLAVQFV